MINGYLDNETVRLASVILIVDDNKSNVLLLESMLKMAGYTNIFSTTDSRETAGMCDAIKPDILLLDLRMPYLDGFQVLEQLNAQIINDFLPVIMITAHGDQESRLKAMELGALDFVGKPFATTEVLARIRNILSIRLLNNEIKEQNIQLESKVVARTTELQEAVEKLNNVRLQLIQKEQLAGIGQLAAGVAHEVNNPLSYVISNVSVLRKYNKSITAIIEKLISIYKYPEKHTLEEIDRSLKEMVGDGARERLGFMLDDSEALFCDIKEGLQRISRIINVLLQFSGLYDRNEIDEYDLNEGIQSILLMLSTELAHCKSVEYKPGELPKIEAVPGQINQVLLNLVLNASYSVKNSGKNDNSYLRISTGMEGDMAYCAIEDSGNGLEGYKLDEDFTPYFSGLQADDGRGMRLGIAYNIIVNKHKGGMELETTADGGSRLVFRLPRHYLLNL